MPAPLFNKWDFRHAWLSEIFDKVMLVNMLLWLVGIGLWLAQELAWKKAQAETDAPH